MLKTIRRQKNWLYKIIAIAVIFSFVAWGLIDFKLPQVGDSALAEAGSVSIKSSEVEETFYYLLRVNGMEDAPPAIGLQLNLLMRAAQLLSDNAILTQEAQSVGALTNDKVLLDIVKQDPSFQMAGEFNRDLFREQAIANGFSENELLEKFRQNSQNTFLARSAAAIVTMPKTAVDAGYDFVNTAYKIQYFRYPFVDIAKIPQPDEANIQAYYDKNKEQFRVPELRQATILIIDPKKIEQKISINQEDLQTVYDKKQQQFKKPERYELQQLIFETQEMAQKAYNELRQNGIMPESYAKQNKQHVQYQDLGWVTTPELMKNVASALTEITPGGVTQPVQGIKGWQIYKVKNHEKEKIQPLAEVRSDIEKEIKNSKTQEELMQIALKIEDKLGSQTPIEEIASELDLHIETLPAVNIFGQDNNKQPIKGLLEDQRIVQSIFKNEKGNTGNLELANNQQGFVVRVNEVVPGYVPELSTIKPAVIEAIRMDEQSKLSVDEAKKNIEDLKSDGSLQKLATEKRKDLKTTEFLKRHDSDKIEDIPPEFWKKIFALKPKQATFVVDDNRQVLVAQVIESETPKSNPDELENIRANLERSLKNDISELYIQALKKKYGFEINKEAYQALYQKIQRGKQIARDEDMGQPADPQASAP